MNRRSFFTSLAGIPAAGALATAKPTVNQIIERGYDESTYRGWTIRWTGWKAGRDNDYMVGQWLGHVPEGFCFDVPEPLYFPGPCFDVYSSHPGLAGPYWKGWFFDISYKEGQHWITPQTDEGEKYLAQREGLLRLLDVIERIHNERLIRKL